jgi:hypothetical protein
MKFGDLCKRVDALRASGIDPQMDVGVSNHYGELEDTLIDLEIVDSPWQGKKRKPFIALVGVSSMYPEPD